MKKISLLFLFIALFPLLVSADTGIRVIEVKGIGISRSEAIQNALIEALKQAEGVSIESQKSFEKKILENSRTQIGQSGHSVKIDKVSQSIVKEATQGLISEYRVINEKTTAASDHEVTLTVKMFQYKTPGISPYSRRMIAVIPFRTSKNSFSMNGVKIPSQEISRRFTQELVNQITQSRRFTVLDRDYNSEYSREKKLLLSGDAPLEEQMRLGNVLGIDYMLVGTISDARIERTTYQIKTIGRSGYADKATFLAEYRIIVMATRQVKWADSVSLMLDASDIKRLTASYDPLLIQQAILQKAAERISQKALANIYPIRIAAIQPDGTLIFNQGGMTVKGGEVFDLFSAGKKVLDPYSGESLGVAETWVASAIIERVLAKISYARIIKGDAAMVKKGDICRRNNRHRKKSRYHGLAQKNKSKFVPKW